MTDWPPIGTVGLFPADHPAPAGWLPADGRRIYRRDHPDLYRCLGRSFRERWPLGWRRHLPDMRDHRHDDDPWVHLVRAR